MTLPSTDPFGTSQQATTVYDYDEMGNEVAQTDAAGHTTTFAYDALGHRTGRTLPGGQSESFGYDLSGNQIYQTNFNGVIITNLYDLGNRLTNQAASSGYSVTFGFSPTGLRTNMMDASGTTTYNYDPMSRLTNKVVAWANGPTRALNYAYNPNSSLKNLWSGSTDGVTNAYQYDLLGRLTNVLANGSVAAVYAFDAVGNLQTLTYGNGVTNLCQYDGMNRLTNQVWKLHGTALANYAYTLGPTGNRTALTETNNGTVRTYGWAYDSMYRLTQEALSGGTSGTLNYGYDLVGNRTNRTSTLTVLTNQSFTFTTNDWLASDAYDKNGNTTNSSGNTYQYDALNHATNANNGAILLAYDGDGNRTRKTVTATGTTTYYLLDDRNPSGYVQVLEEWTATGGTTNLNRVYNYGMGLISQQAPLSSTNYFIFDGHGSTRILVDLGGSVNNVFTYDAYGTLIASNMTSQTTYLYCGQQFDSDLGFYYQRARYMNQNTGRFWTMDTYQGDTEDPLSLHKYLYAGDNPINRIDPSGQAWAFFSGDAWGQLLHDIFVGDLSGPARDPYSQGVLSENAGYGFHQLYDADGNSLGNPASAIGMAVIGGIINFSSLFDGGAEAKGLKCEVRILQKMFDKHGADFGLIGNWNPSRLKDVVKEIGNHVDDPAVKKIPGTYRGLQIINYVNPTTGVNVFTDTSGGVLGGWKLGVDQLQSVLTTGRLF
jgi:RHS repeat-associated protein